VFCNNTNLLRFKYAIVSVNDWLFLEGFSNTHLLQTAEWGVLKELQLAVIRVRVGDAGV
jgi:hypothetical protein